MFSFLLQSFCYETNSLSKQPFIVDLKYSFSQDHSKYLKKNVCEEFHVLVKLTILLKINFFGRTFKRWTLLLSIFLVPLWNFKCIFFALILKNLCKSLLFAMKKLFVFWNWIGVLKIRALIQLYKKDLFYWFN